MRHVRTCVAIAASISIMLLMSACSSEFVAPPVAVAPQGPPAPPELPLSAPPERVHAEIVRWFTAAGYREFRVAAVAEHARIESGYRPCAAGAAGLRYTFQWGGTRLQRLYEFAGTRHCPPLAKQLAFADSELRSDPNYSCFWQTTTKAAALAALHRGFGHGRC
jgi:hypothetical protein